VVALTDRAENRRLAPLVETAYNVYRGILAVPGVSADRKQDPLPGSPREIYVEGLRREIEDSYSTRPGTVDLLLDKVRDGTLAGFSEEDCLAAVQVLDAFLEAALFIESRHGDSPEAVEALQEELPGLPGWLYSDVIGLYGYINR
jgi:hypothetical protein